MDPLGAGPSARRLALTVTLAFLGAGLAWILLTDVMLYRWIHDPTLIARVETAKGWAFVGGAAALLYGVAYGTTSRLARMRRLAVTVIESIADGVLLLGPDRAVLHANAAALAMLGAEGNDELAGMDAATFSRRYRVSYPNGALVPPGRFVSQRAFEEGGPVRYKCVLHPPGRAELVLSCTGAAVREDADEAPQRVVSVMHDITESERLNELRDQFFAAAAHTLKTPLTIMSAHAQLLSRTSSSEVRRSAEAIDRQCAHVDVLVQNLLVLARAHSGTLRLHTRPVRLSDVVERVARGAERAAPDRRVETLILDDVSAHVDDERMVIALRNVLEESSRPTPAAPVGLVLRRVGDDAELGVRCPAPPADVLPEPPVDDDRAVRAEVTKIVVAAHGGRLAEERTDTERAWWIRLPAIPEGGE